MERYEVRLSGSGGQGIIVAGIILAEAAGIYEGKQVCQTQAYGPEARGGASKAEVVISDGEIDYPKAIKPDMVLAMNQKACDSYCYDLKPGGLIIVDGTLVKDLPTPRAIALPFTHIARQELGKEMVANIVALGALGKDFRGGGRGQPGESGVGPGAGGHRRPEPPGFGGGGGRSRRILARQVTPVCGW